MSDSAVIGNVISRAELARRLGVSRTYITLLAQGKRQPSRQLVDQLRQLLLTSALPDEFASACVKWGSGDSNPDALRHMILSHAHREIPTLHRHGSRISDAYPAESCTAPENLTRSLLDQFLASRRQGLSKHSMLFYAGLLSKAIGMELSPQGINAFLTTLPCKNGKYSYFRAIRVLCNWMVRNNIVSTNPLSNVDPPKIRKKILPSITESELCNLLSQTNNIRDKALISLLADSGMRLSEVAYIKSTDIDWTDNTIMIWGKGNKQRRAPFTDRTALLLRELLEYDCAGDNVWHLTRRGIQSMLHGYREKTGLPCNAHTFRRTFASNLHRRGVDVEHIMRLGGWETLDMVLRYTRSVKFEESLRLYRQV